MLRTITVGSCVSIQGLVVETLACGKMVVRVGERLFVGHPIAQFRPS